LVHLAGQPLVVGLLGLGGVQHATHAATRLRDAARGRVVRAAQLALLPILLEFRVVVLLVLLLHAAPPRAFGGTYRRDLRAAWRTGPPTRPERRARPRDPPPATRRGAPRAASGGHPRSGPAALRAPGRPCRCRGQAAARAAAPRAIAPPGRGCRAFCASPCSR